MGIKIEDGTGGGELVGVTSNKLRTLSVNLPLTFHQSLDPHHRNVYTAIGTVTPINGTAVSLFVKNNSSLFLCVDRIMVQTIAIGGGTPVPNTSAYITVGFDRTYSALGSSVTPVNLNNTTGNTASVTAYKGPTLTGTFTEAYRWYVEAANSSRFDLVPQGGDGIILGNTNTIEISYVSDNTSGTILTNMTFFFTDEAHSAP